MNGLNETLKQLKNLKEILEGILTKMREKGLISEAQRKNLLRYANDDSGKSDGHYQKILNKIREKERKAQPQDKEKFQGCFIEEHDRTVKIGRNSIPYRTLEKELNINSYNHGRYDYVDILQEIFRNIEFAKRDKRYELKRLNSLNEIEGYTPESYNEREKEDLVKINRDFDLLELSLKHLKKEDVKAYYNVVKEFDELRDEIYEYSFEQLEKYSHFSYNKLEIEEVREPGRINTINHLLNKYDKFYKKFIKLIEKLPTETKKYLMERVDSKANIIFDVNSKLEKEILRTYWTSDYRTKEAIEYSEELFLRFSKITNYMNPNQIESLRKGMLAPYLNGSEYYAKHESEAKRRYKAINDCFDRICISRGCLTSRDIAEATKGLAYEEQKKPVGKFKKMIYRILRKNDREEMEQ